MKLGIVGLPNVGKSTLFNCLTGGGAVSANYPFCTIDPNVGVVTVPDARLGFLEQLYNAQKVVPAIIEFVDIAGLVKGASKGEGLGNKFLGNIREVDAIVHVVRCFVDDNVVHVDGSIGPSRDIETINLELIFSDLEQIERKIARTVKAAKADKSLQKELDMLNELKEILEKGQSARTYEPKDDDEKAILTNFGLLTNKPVIYAANVAESDLEADGTDNEHVKKVREIAGPEGSLVITLCAKLEEEIKDMTEEEKVQFLEDLGLSESGLKRLISASYELLGLHSFLTAGEKEVKAWTIKKGTTAQAAAGKIHSDIERGFIRAETVSFEDLKACGDMAEVKKKGLMRLEGKEYIVNDGDVIVFRFNV